MSVTFEDNRCVVAHGRVWRLAQRLHEVHVVFDKSQRPHVQTAGPRCIQCGVQARVAVEVFDASSP